MKYRQLQIMEIDQIFKISAQQHILIFNLLGGFIKSRKTKLTLNSTSKFQNHTIQFGSKYISHIYIQLFFHKFEYNNLKL